MKKGRLSFPKLVVQLLLLLTQITLGAMVLYYLLEIPGLITIPHQDRSTYIFTLLFTTIFLIFPSVYFTFTLSVFRKTLRSPLAIIPFFSKEKKRANLTLFVGMLLFNLTLICFIWSTAYTLFVVLEDKPPAFFPFNDAQSSYVMEQVDKGIYRLHYLNSTGSNKRWVCTKESGKSEACKMESWSEFTFDIGKSPVLLSAFVKKEVIIEGTFVYSDKQCIAHICTTLYPHAAIDIKTIKLK